MTVSTRQIVVENIPQFLKEFCLWCAWTISHANSEQRVHGGKVPCSPITGKTIKVNDATEWAPFSQAIAAFNQDERFAGIGVLIPLEQQLIGIDLDDCIDGDNNINPWAAEILRHFPTYAEVSPSGKGIKIFAIGTLPGRIPNRTPYHEGSIEVYDRLRFFTVTGQRVSGVPGTVENCQGGIDWLASLFAPPDPAPPVQAQQYPPADFYTIISECCWLQRCRDDAATLPEPEWYRMLSIVSRCSDPEELAHGLSRPHRKYNHDETRLKLIQAKENSGPVTCEYVAGGLGQTAICHTCRHWRRITSPINLGTPKPVIAAPGRGNDELPIILTTDRDLRDMTREGVEALQRANEPPVLFIRSGQMTRILRDEMGRYVISPVNEPILRGHLARAANFRCRWIDREGGARLKPVGPPKDVVADHLALAPMEWHLPPIESVCECPIIRPDGTVFTEGGYDPLSRVYFAKADGLVIPTIPLVPSREQIAESLALVREMFIDFPFIDRASLANLISIPLTLIVRRAIKGSVPLFLIDAPAPATGKSLLAEIISILLTGLEAAMKPAPSYEEEEWRKTLSAVLMDGTSICVFDNVAHRLESPSLALILTASIWTDRLLGQTKTITLPIRPVFVATGNNLVLGGDLPRRAVWIRLDAKTAEPHKRRDFRHPKLKNWISERRGELLGAYLLIARAWFASGRPRADVPVLGSFESWCEILGGILEYAGVPDFLANFDEMYREGDPSGQQWEAFLAALHDVFKGQPFTIHQVLDKLEETPRSPNANAPYVPAPPPGLPPSPASLLVGMQADISKSNPPPTVPEWVVPEPPGNPLKEAVPDELADDPRKANLQRRMAYAFRQRVGRRYGRPGYHLMKAGLTSNKVVKWVVVVQNPNA